MGGYVRRLSAVARAVRFRTRRRRMAFHAGFVEGCSEFIDPTGPQLHPDRGPTKARLRAAYPRPLAVVLAPQRLCVDEAAQVRGIAIGRTVVEELVLEGMS